MIRQLNVHGHCYRNSLHYYSSTVSCFRTNIVPRHGRNSSGTPSSTKSSDYPWCGLNSSGATVLWRSLHRRGFPTIKDMVRTPRGQSSYDETFIDKEFRLSKTWSELLGDNRDALPSSTRISDCRWQFTTSLVVHFFYGSIALKCICIIFSMVTVIWKFICMTIP